MPKPAEVLRPKPRKPVTFWQRLREIDMFFAGQDEVHQTMRRLHRRLKRAGIAHAVVGGLAVNAHGHERTTKDVDILLTAEGFATFHQLFVPKNYTPVAGRRRQFVDRLNDTHVDVLVTGMYPGSGRPGPIAYPDPTAATETVRGVPVVNLVTLVTLKLAARRHQDFADVVNLIRAHDLDESFAAHLHRTLRRDYVECLEEKRREDEYLERNG